MNHRPEALEQSLENGVQAENGADNHDPDLDNSALLADDNPNFLIAQDQGDGATFTVEAAPIVARHLAELVLPWSS